MRQVCFLLALLASLVTVGLGGRPRAATREEPAAGKRVVAYFTEWSVYQRNYHVRDIPAARLTHVNYAFARIVNGECAPCDAYAAVDKFYPGDKWDAGFVRGSFHQLQLLRQKRPHLRALISVGGWTLSGPFSDVALTEQSRQKFGRSCVAFLLKYGFDGVDIDWEYPVGGGPEGNKTRPEDRRNYTLLLAELRRQLDARGKADGKHYLLTVAAPAGPAVYANLELGRIHRHLDWLNLMTYDFHGGWSPRTNLHAPLFASSTDPTKDEAVRTRFNVDAAVKAYLRAGVPADKLVVGVPFYGRGWGGVRDVNHGLYQPRAAALPRGTWEPGVWDYKDLAANYVGKKGRRFWHEEARAPWLFDDRAGLMISYEDPQSCRLKGEYVRRHGLGGVMCWELSLDDRDSSLLRALQAGLRSR
jgi:chitinase